MTILGQLNRLHPTGLRSGFNWLGAFFRTIAYDVGFNTIPKPTYQQVIDLEDLSLEKRVKHSAVVPVGGDTRDMLQGLRQSEKYQEAPTHDDSEHNEECKDEHTKKTVETVASKGNDTQITALVTQYRQEAKDKWRVLQGLENDVKVDVYLELSTAPIIIKNYLRSNTTGPSERAQFANCLVEHSTEQEIKNFVQQLKNADGDIQAFKTDLNEENSAKVQRAMSYSQMLCTGKIH